MPGNRRRIFATDENQMHTDNSIESKTIIINFETDRTNRCTSAAFHLCASAFPSVAKILRFSWLEFILASLRFGGSIEFLPRERV
jgi:hypothetical protein